MPEYKAPLRDIKFVMDEMLNIQAHYSEIPCGENASPDMVDAIIQEGAKFCEQVLSPLNQVGDEEGCQLSSDGVVTTPKGFKEAYQQYIEGGWPSISAAEEYEGQGLPESLGLVMSEMVGTANWAWGMYPGLSHGAVNTLMLHGSDEQKAMFLPKLVSGEWTGTMCLTEAQAGSDLGILRCKAVPNADGSFNITGTKIFISAGDHDLTENIVHIVLARLPDAPAGTKGISLFVIPKINVNTDGSLGEPNAVSCGSLEHKMGIHGNSTCVINFDDSKGYLIGKENKGLNYMFTFMNVARLGTALQGLGASELSYQGAIRYAKERIAMRALTGIKNPDGAADPIIVHPDVRRMLLTQKAFAEGSRAMIYFTAIQADLVHYGTTEEIRKAADDMMGFLTPIAKAFLTEISLEAAYNGMQVYGGHGYVNEWGMEQIYRDTRVATMYEGTTGIQALDLLGRKILMTQGASLKQFTKIVHLFCKEQADNEDMKVFIEPLAKANKGWSDMIMKVGMAAMKNRDEVGAASFDFLMYSGYVCFAYFWARMALVAKQKLAEGTTEENFYNSKVQTAKFYFDRLLPRTAAHASAALSGADNLMDMDEASFG
jgi:alkylation response protein AidB-like acyl-CoA dehydrogenase